MKSTAKQIEEFRASPVGQARAAVVEAVRQLVGAYAAQGEAAFQNGPPEGYQYEITEDNAVTVLAEAVAEGLGDYLARDPSTAIGAAIMLAAR